MPARPQFLLRRQGGAVDLVGEENRGLEYMFVMMNLAAGQSASRARYLRAGLSAGPCLRERAHPGPPDRRRRHRRMAIIHHPDVRRMLMTMKAETEAMRAVAYAAARAIDFAAATTIRGCAHSTRPAST